MSESTPYDVAIVGAGPAGLSAALLLARCRRSVILIDDGHPRNFAARRVNGYLGLAGVSPFELRELGCRQAIEAGVDYLEGHVTKARRGEAERAGFRLSLENGADIRSRKLVLATGLRDELPQIAGLAELYGKCVHHCPYCDGWEHRDRRLAAIGEGRKAVGLALALKNWSPLVTACTEGATLSLEEEEALCRNGIGHRSERPIRLTCGDNGGLRQIEFDCGAALECDAVFFVGRQLQTCDLAMMLGCDCNDRGTIPTDRKMHTNVKGLFLAGDANGEAQFAIVAAAEGATAAMAINRELQEEQFGGL